MGAKRSPKGTQFEPQGTKSEPKGGPNALKSRPSEKVKKKVPGPPSQMRRRGGTIIYFLVSFWEHFPYKMCSKIDAKFDVEKVWTFIRKCSQNDAKTMSKIDDKSMNFRNLTFLVFWEEYNVKIVFLT